MTLMMITPSLLYWFFHAERDDEIFGPPV